jgi:NADH-quinone oxidoreductase subunit H
LVFILLGTVGLFALMDRLLMAALQRRSGPYNIGWFGLLQPILDGVKLIKKELIIVQKYNGIMFISGPILLFLLSLLL